MNETTKIPRDSYYKAAGTWAVDRQDALRTSRKIAWIVAAVAVLVALLEAIALIVLMPLKTVVPYTLLVDRNTGFVETLKPLDPATIAPDKALTQSFLVQYVLARETFDIDALQSNYRKASLWSAEAARSEYVSGVQASNSDSPLARLPRSTVISARVKSISPLGGNSALVRFDTQRRDARGQAQPPQAWVSIIRYRFSGEPMQREDRFLNPLGFQVLRYRRDAEALPPPDPPAALPVISLPGAAVIPDERSPEAAVRRYPDPALQYPRRQQPSSGGTAP